MSSDPSFDSFVRQVDALIIGGGAAGVFAAISCAERSPRASVLVVDKGPLLAKVRISGGGRCNVTHHCFDPRELVQHYPRGHRELLGPFHAWQPRDTIDWFQQHGVELKTEEDGRMFPVTDSSQTIIDCLLATGRKHGVRFDTGHPMRTIRPLADGGFEAEFADDRRIRCGRLLLATGGLKPGPLKDLIESLGHTIAPLAPSLFTFHIRDERLAGLQGLSVPNAVASIPDGNFSRSGPVLITHWGLSGPAILKLSAWAARWAMQCGYQFQLDLNWTGEGPDGVHQAIADARRQQSARPVRRTPLFNLPTRLWERLVAAAEIAETVTWNQLRREPADALAAQLTRCRLAVTGKSMFKEEFVTCGGVALNEVSFKRMESRLVPGLHFAGELLDIDGVTGGFNFQAAWTTGRLAGQAIANALV